MKLLFEKGETKMLRMSNATLLNTTMEAYCDNMFNLASLEPTGYFYHTWKSSDKTGVYNCINIFDI
jgi:hypothetical protein